MAACDKQAPEKAAIRQAFKDLEQAYAENKGHHASELVTPESLTYYGELLRVAMDGKPEEVKKRPTMDRFEIYTIRHNANRKALKGLDGRGYQTFTTDQGWWSDPDLESWTESLHSIKIDSSGAKAWTYIMEGGRPTSYRVNFEKIDGRWRIDELSIREYSGRIIEENAQRERMNVEEYMFKLIEYESGRPVDRGAMQRPMPK